MAGLLIAVKSVDIVYAANYFGYIKGACCAELYLMMHKRRIMLKAFLSHSSKQKGYVEIVAKHLGKSNIIFDEWTFEEGNKTIDEIFLGYQKPVSLFYLYQMKLLKVNGLKRKSKKLTK